MSLPNPLGGKQIMTDQLVESAELFVAALERFIDASARATTYVSS